MTKEDFSVVVRFRWFNRQLQVQVFPHHRYFDFKKKSRWKVFRESVDTGRFMPYARHLFVFRGRAVRIVWSDIGREKYPFISWSYWEGTKWVLKPDGVFYKSQPPIVSYGFAEFSDRVPFQINGVITGELGHRCEATCILSDPVVIKAVDGRKVERVVIVPGKLVNIITGVDNP